METFEEDFMGHYDHAAFGIVQPGYIFLFGAGIESKQNPIGTSAFMVSIETMLYVLEHIMKADDIFAFGGISGLSN